MVQFVFLILHFYWGQIVNARLDTNLIKTYSESKNLRQGTIFSCQNAKESAALIKSFARENLQFLVVNSEIIPGKVWERKVVNLAVIVDGSCENITDTFSQDEKYFFEPYHWLIIAKSNSEFDKIINSLESAPLNVNCDINIALLDQETATWTIFDAYNPAYNHQGHFTISKIGLYNENIGYNAKIVSNKYWVRKNMSGVQFKSAVVIPNPSVTVEEYLSSEEDRQDNSMHRFQSVTIRYCKEFFNFTLHVQRTNSWGYKGEDGRFDGLVGLLEQRLVDFGSSPLIYKLDRMPVVDYSYGNWILRSTFMYRRPKIIEASYRIFLRPLSSTVWICIILVMSVITLILKVTFSREKRLLVENNGPDAVDSSWSFLVLFTLGAFCQQGATCYPQLISSRTLSIFVFLFCILIYQFYSASIVSYLLMDPPRKINNLQDLMESDLKAGIEDILIDRNYFVQTTDPVTIELYEKKIKTSGNDSSGFLGPEEGLELVRRGGFAYHVETSTAYPIIENTFTNQEICELEEVQMYRTQPMYTNLQKNSPFKEMMNYFMLHLVENGIMDRLRKYWDARTPTCIESAKKIELQVGLKEFACGLIVLFYGIGISLVFLLIEIAMEAFGRDSFQRFRFHKRPVVNTIALPYAE